MIIYTLLALGMYRAVVRLGATGPLVTLPHSIIPDCVVCEADVEPETLLTFSSTRAEYQLLVCDSQLVGHDYFSWVSACSGKWFTYTSEYINKYYAIMC